MNKASLTEVWDNFRTTHGIGIRAVASIPADKIDAHPVPNMRSPKELVCHMYESIAELTSAVARGECKDPTPAEEKAAQAITTRDQLLAFCRDKWSEAERTMSGLTEAQVTGTVKTPWGHDFSGHGMVRVLIDEYWHHRGQLYVFLRALGVSPHSLYDFEHNAPEHQPGAKATT